MEYPPFLMHAYRTVVMPNDMYPLDWCREYIPSGDDKISYHQPNNEIKVNTSSKGPCSIAMLDYWSVYISIFGKFSGTWDLPYQLDFQIWP